MPQKLFLIALVVALVGAGITAAVMIALGSDDDRDSRVVFALRGDVDKGFSSDLFNNRVASILGIEEERLESALKQAGKELKEEEVGGKLDGLVEEGALTRGQADDFLDWYEDRPDIPLQGPELREFKGRHHLVPDGDFLERGPRGLFFRFRGGPLQKFGELPDKSMFRFHYDGNDLSQDSEICLFLKDGLGRWWDEICEDEDHDGDDNDWEGKDIDDYDGEDKDEDGADDHDGEDEDEDEDDDRDSQDEYGDDADGDGDRNRDDG